MIDRRAMVVVLALTACTGGGASETNDTDVVDTDVADTDIADTDVAETDTDADTDADADSDTDTDSDADTDADSDTDADPVLLASYVPADTVQNVGDDAVDASRRWAIAIHPGPAALTSVDVWLKGTAAADTDLVVSLQSGGAAGPDGTELGTRVVVSGAAIPTTDSFVSAVFTAPITVTDTAWIVLAVSDGSTGSFIGHPYSTGVADQLALSDSNAPFELYSKAYQWPYRVFGRP